MRFHLEVSRHLLELLRLQRVQLLLLLLRLNRMQLLVLVLVLRMLRLLLRLGVELELLQLVRCQHGLHRLVVVEHLLVASKRAWHGTKVHHPSTTIGHLSCCHLQPLDLCFQCVIQSCTKNSKH
jgi:hypothetical protein